MSRIFISHSSKDNRDAACLRDWLASNGWDDVFLDLDPILGLAPGEHWQNALKAAADRCEAVLFLISPNWLASHWCLSEFLLAKQLGKRLFPLLIAGASMEGLPNEIASDHQAVDLIGDPHGWDRLKQGLRRAGLDANSFAFPPGRRPYPGFEPLTEADAAIFFGREAQVLRGLDRLRLMRDAGAERMMVVLGASGAGKSSFLRAGLSPRLRRDDRNFWPLPTIRPERAALSGKSGLFAALEATLADERVAKRQEIAQLPRARAGLGAMVAREGSLTTFLSALRGATVQPFSQGAGSIAAPVILIDQGEELLNEEGRGESERFFDILARTLETDKNLIVVVAIRSDAFPRLQAESRLAGIVREPFDLAPMPEGSLRLVIEGPAKLATPPLKPEAALVDALLADSTGHDALPLLAFTLDRLARDYGAEGTLTLANYVAAGGVRGAITLAVEEALAEGRRRGATPSESRALENLLKQAFVPHLAVVNEMGEFARRIASAHEIPVSAKPLVDLLVEARLLTRDLDDHGETIEVAHEALLREWPLLRGFLEADREFLVGKQQLAEDLKTWEEAPPNGKPDALLTGLRLTRAQHWLAERSVQDLTDNERAFIGESVRAVENARRLRKALVLTAIVLLAAFSAFSVYQWANAARQTAVALVEKARANSNAEEARMAKDRAEENARKAETNEARAHGAQAKAQAQESISLADQSLRQTVSGDILGAMRTAIAALPSDPAKPDRPYVPKADYALAKAVLANRLIATITPSADWVNAVAFSPDGSRIGVGTRDGFVKIYDAASFRELNAMNDQRGSILQLAFSEDGKWLATAHGGPNSLIVRDAGTGAVSNAFRLNATPFHMTLTPDGSRLVAASGGGIFGDGRPNAFELGANNARVLDFPPTPSDLASRAFWGLSSFSASPDGKLLLLATNSDVIVWDLVSGAVVATTLPVQTGAAPSAGFDSSKFDFSNFDEDEKISAGAFVKATGDLVLVGKRTVYVIDPRSAAIKIHWTFADDWTPAPRQPLVTSSGDKLVIPLSKSILATYALADGRLIAKRQLPSAITTVAISPDDQILAAAGEDLLVRAWPLDSDADLGVFTGHGERIAGIAFSPDSARIVTYGDKTLRLWDLRDSAGRLASLPSTWKVEAVDARATKAAVVNAGGDGLQPDRNQPPIGIWDVAQAHLAAGESVSAFHRDGAKITAFSHSGKWLALRWNGKYPDGEPKRKQMCENLARLAREAGQGDAPLDVRADQHIDAIAIVDADTGLAAHFLVAQEPQTMPEDIAFLGDDGATLGLAESHYGDRDNEESQSSAEVWDVATGKKLLAISQEGHDAKLVFSATGRFVTFATSSKLHFSKKISSIWSLTTGSKIASLDRPLPPDGEMAAALAAHDRIFFGDENFRPALIETSTGREVGNVAGPALGLSALIMSGSRRRLLVQGVEASRALWSLEDQKKLALTPDPELELSNATFTDDSLRIVTRGKRGDKYFIEVFDSDTGRRLKSIEKPATTLEQYGGFTGARVAVRTDSRTIEIDEIDSNAATVRITLQNNLHRWRFAASDERLVTVDESGKLQVWDARSGSRVFELLGADTVDPLGGGMAIGARVPVLFAHGGVAVLDAGKGEIVWRSPDDEKVVFAQLAPDGKSIDFGGANKLEVLTLDDGERIASFPLATSDHPFGDYNEQGDRLFVYVRGARNDAHLIDIAARKEIGHYTGAAIALLAPKGDSLALATQDKLSIYETRAGTLTREVAFERTIRTVDFNNSGDGLAVVTDDARIFAVDVEGGAPKPVAALRQQPTWIRFAADRSKLLIYETSNLATLHDTATGQILTSFTAEWSKRASLNPWIARIDRGADFLAVRSPDNYIHVYRAADGAQTSMLNWDDNTFADMAFSSDGRQLIAVTEKGSLLDWDLAANKGQAVLQLEREYTRFDPVTLKRTPDPSQIIAIDKRGEAILYSIGFNVARKFYTGEPESQVNATLSPDGSLLAVMGAKGVLRFWHVAANEVLMEIPGFESIYPAPELRFSPDGRVLVIFGRSDKIKLIRSPMTGDALLRFAKESVVGGPQATAASAPRPLRLGVLMKDISAETARRHSLPAPRGAEVIDLVANGAAQAAGVRVGDVIIKVNGTPVSNVAETSEAIKNAHLDLSLEIIRDGAPVTARAALDD